MNHIKRVLRWRITHERQASNDQQSQRNNNGAPDSAPIALVERAGQHRHVVHNSGKLSGKSPSCAAAECLRHLFRCLTLVLEKRNRQINHAWCVMDQGT